MNIVKLGFFSMVFAWLIIGSTRLFLGQTIPPPNVIEVALCLLCLYFIARDKGSSMDIEERKRQIGAAAQELNRYLDGIETRASLLAENTQLRALLRSIVDETYPGCPNMDKRGRYVKSGGGYRRLPDDLAALINEAAEVVGD